MKYEAGLLPWFKKRGSYIAEAAVVLPFVFLSVITAVLIIMFFYESSVSESQMHMALRCEADTAAGELISYGEDGSVLSSEDLWDGRITSSGISLAKRIHGDAEVSMVHKGLLYHAGSRRLSDDLRVTDPVRSLRIRQAVRGVEDSLSPGGETAGGVPTGVAP